MWVAALYILIDLLNIISFLLGSLCIYGSYKNTLKQTEILHKNVRIFHTFVHMKLYLLLNKS